MRWLEKMPAGGPADAIKARTATLLRRVGIVGLGAASAVLLVVPGALGQDAPVENTRSTCEPADLPSRWPWAMYSDLYLREPEDMERYLYEYLQPLQFGHLQKVRELVVNNRKHLRDAFVSLHAPDLLDPNADLFPAGDSDLTTVGLLGPDPAHPEAARAALDLSDSEASDAQVVRMVVGLVCFKPPGADSAAIYTVPLSDLCRALRAADAPRQCTKALLRRAKRGLPDSLAQAPAIPPVVVTTTTVPPTTSPPYTGPPITREPSDGYCPDVGERCDPLLPRADPDCNCSRI